MLSTKNNKTLYGALKGFSWNVTGSLIRAIAGFVINILLARILGPQPFGVIAVALLIIGIGNLIIESGLGASLIQKEEIVEKEIAFVFTLQMLLGLVLFASIVVLAPWIALQFKIQDAAAVLQVMAFALVIQAFAQVPAALLRRNLDFKSLQIAQIISFLIGYLVVGISMAVANFGVWSLVAANLVQNGINAAILYWKSPHKIFLTLSGSSQITLFGLRVLIANIANWLIQYVDQTIIGRKFGAQNLGYYSRAYFLNWTITGIVLSSAQTTLFSAVSRMGKSEETKRVFLGSMKIFAFIFFPLYWLIALESHNIISVIYGKDWLPAAELLTPLAFSMPFLVLVGLEGPLLNGLGKPHYEMWAQWITAVIAVLTLTIAANVSLIITAWSILFIYLFRFFIMSIVTIKTINLSWQQLVTAVIGGPVLGSGAMGLWLLAKQLALFASTPILESLARVLPVLLILFSVIWATRHWLLPEYPVIIKIISRNRDETLK